MNFKTSIQLLLVSLVLLVSAQAQFISTGTQIANPTSITLSYVTAAPATTVVQYGPTIALAGGSVQAEIVPTTKHSVTITGLSPSTTFQWRVLATDNFGEIATSNYQKFVTAASQSVVSLSWQEGQAGVTFNVYRGSTAGGPYTKIATPTASAYIDSTVVQHTTYYYVTTAIDPTTNGESADSNEVVAIIP